MVPVDRAAGPVPTHCPTFRSATMLQCRIPPPKCGTSTEQSQQLDRKSHYFIKTQSDRILAGTSNLFEKEVHCQLLAPHLACHQPPLNPAILPALPTDPFSYQRIQHGSSATLLTHQSLVGRCKVMNSVTLMLFAIQWYRFCILLISCYHLLILLLLLPSSPLIW